MRVKGFRDQKFGLILKDIKHSKYIRSNKDSVGQRREKIWRRQGDRC